MTSYFAIFGFSSLAALITRSRKVSFYLLITFAVLLVFFAGTRYEVGCDWTGYLLRFQRFYRQETWASLMAEAEAGFHFLNFAVINAGLDYEIMILLASVVYVFCLARFSALSERPLDVLVLMFPILVLQLGMSGLRQALALGFLLLAFRALVERRRLTIFAWVLIASTFHTSALIFLPLALMARSEISIPRILLSFAILGPVALFLMGERLELYEARYIAQEFGESSSAGAWYRYAIALVPFLGFEWKRALVERRFPKLFPLLRLFSLVALSLPVVGLISSVALHRLGFYVLPVSILAMVCVAEVAFAQGSRRFARALPFLAYGLYLVVWFVSSRHASLCYVPYDSWLM